MFLFIVGTPIGNLKDITERALKVLKTVRIIAVEKWSDSIKLLNHFDIHPERIITYDEKNKKLVTPELLKILQSQDIALITSAGMPGISDPGADLIRACREQNIKIVPIPGPSALTAAMSVCGFAGDFLFIGYAPKKRGQILKIFEEAKNHRYNLVFFESTHRLKKTLIHLSENYPETLIFFGKEMTKKFETYPVSPPSELLALIDKDKKFSKGEFTLIVNFAKLKS